MTVAKCLAAVAFLSLTVCGGAATVAASPPMLAVRKPAVVVSGQSNAMFLTPFLTAVYPDVQSVAEGSQSIDLWAPDGRLWLALAPKLRDRPRAFVWWQGETDGQLAIPGYAAKLADLFRRVRATARDPKLLIVIVRVVPMPELESIRTVQAAWVKADRHARLVSCDDLPRQSAGSYHLSEAGYQEMVRRLTKLLR